MDLNTTAESGAGITIDGMTVADHLTNPGPSDLLYHALAAAKNRRGEVNLADPAKLAEVRRSNPKLSEQALPLAELEKAVGELVGRGRIALAGWNGTGKVPTIFVSKKYQIRVFHVS